MDGWSRRAVEERGVTYVDHVAGDYRVARGYDEAERVAGRPWSLLRADRFVGTYESLVAAKRAAADLEAALDAMEVA